MGIEDFGGLEKLTIKSIDGTKVFKAMFNPESYSVKYSSDYKKITTINPNKNVATVIPLPQDYNLHIVIDGTGVSSMFGIGEPVSAQVENFLDMTWNNTGGDPPLLNIFWGQIAFECTMQEVSINYTLFDQTGMPLRAELDAVFKSKDLNNQDATSKQGGSGSKVSNGIVISVS